MSWFKELYNNLFFFYYKIKNLLESMMSKDIPSKINIEDDYSKSKVKQEIIIIEKTNNDEYYIKI